MMRRQNALAINKSHIASIDHESDLESEDWSQSGKPMDFFKSQTMSPDKLLARSTVEGKKVNLKMSNLDRECKEFQQQTATENKQLFMENYGIKYQLPSIQILASQFYSNDARYCLQLIKYIFPYDCEQNLEIFCWDGSIREQCLCELTAEQQSSTGISFRLLMQKSDQLFDIGETTVPQCDNGLFKFSENGKLLAFYNCSKNRLQLYNVHDINNLLQEIEEDVFQVLHHQELIDEDDSITNIEFDSTSRYIAVSGPQKLVIFDCMDIEKQPVIYKLDTMIYKKIYFTRIIIDQTGSLRCQIAALRQEKKKICIFDIFDRHKDDNIISINFFSEPSKHMQVCISNDHNELGKINMVFVNENENFLFQLVQGEPLQKNLPQLNKKIVRHVWYNQFDGNFYFLACKEYDHKIDVQNSESSEFLVEIQREIEPNILTVFDIDVSYLSGMTQDQDSVYKRLRTVSLLDDQFILDQVTYREILPENVFISRKVENNSGSQNGKFDPNSLEYQAYFHSDQRAFSFQWPYLSFRTYGNSLVVINAYDQETISCIQVTNNNSNVNILQIYISESKDLFFLTKINQWYELYQIDLDQCQTHHHDYCFERKFTFKKLFSYRQKDVADEKLISFHVRGSSQKEAVDMNFKLKVFLIHGNDLYCWSKLSEKTTSGLQLISRIDSKQLYKIDDNVFFFLRRVKVDDKQKDQIVQVTIRFSFQDIKVIYEQESFREKIITFNIDQVYRKILILTEKVQKHKLKFLDLDKEEIEFETYIQQEVLLGILVSGLYTFIAGHIYQSNNCIKIRYDLINSDIKFKLQENEIFDFYLNIFDLVENQRVKIGTPLDSFSGHKQAYIMNTKNEPSELLILPYLHDRRIYLNRLKTNTEYFYTSIETSIINQSIRKNNNDEFKSLFQSHADPPKLPPLAERGKTYSMKTGKVQYCLDQAVTSILCVNMTESKYYVYSQNGQLLNRVEFADLFERMGKPIETSTNGLCFLMKKDWKQLKQQSVVPFTETEFLREYLTVNIFKIDVNELKHIKSYSFFDEVFELVKNEGILTSSFSIVKYMEQSKLKFLINDNCDVLLKINNLYFFNAGWSQIDQTSIQLFTKNIEKFAAKIEFGRWINMNSQYLFFYDEKEVKYLNLTEKLEEKNLKNDLFSCDKDDENSNINELIVGNNQHIIAISCTYSSKTDYIVLWNIEANSEIETVEVGKMYQVIWDNRGSPYIVTDKSVFFSAEKCQLQAYDVADSIMRIESSKKNSGSLHQMNGRRFDGKNHNWIIFNGYLCLPFSYMTFVIMDKIEKKDPLQKDNVFDIEPYNYVYNKSTSFLDGEFIKFDYKQLTYVLQSMEKIDVQLLQLLAYTQPINGGLLRNSALRKTLTQGSKRNVNIVLTYMSKLNYQSIYNFLDMYPQLLEYQAFNTYLEKLTIQTKQLEDKEILKVGSALDEEIIALGAGNKRYIDNRFFRQQMKEDWNKESNKSYPVDIISLKVSHFILTPQGVEFLNAIIKANDIDVYNNPTVELLIEFIFQKFKQFLFIRRYPFFMAQVVVFLLLMQWHDKLDYQSGATVDGHVGSESTIRTYQILVSICLCVLVCLQLMLLYQNLQILRVKKMQYFRRMYSYVDLILVGSNMTICYLIAEELFMGHEESEEEGDSQMSVVRRAGVITTALLSIRMTYMMKIIDEVAPLIDIIGCIFYDIRYFILIMVLFGLALANCFSLLANNQIDMDNISHDDRKIIPYKTLSSALWFMYTISIGQAETEAFDLGKGSQSSALYLLYFFSTFIMLIHLLNMLIAIMSNTFSERQLKAKAIKCKDRLVFIMDNWQLFNLVFEDKKSIKYVFAAYYAQANDNDQEDDNMEHFLHHIEKMERHQYQMMSHQRTIMEELKELKEKQNWFERQQKLRDDKIESQLGSLMQK